MAESSNENDIIEGFLCPICKADLKNLDRLKTHFQENHPEDQDVLKSLKDLFGKATKKILKLDEDVEPVKPNLDYYDIEPEYQEIGYTISHTKYFKAVRCSKLEHFATETNKLIIRLDFLLRIDSSNSERRQREQEVVEWLDGSTVKLCPQCAKSFNLTRRQHHCRLCGSIMCHSCTSFLSRTVARVRGYVLATSDFVVVLDSIISGLVSNKSEIPTTLDETNSFRLCTHCMALLESRRRFQINRNVRPVICVLYDELYDCMRKSEHSIELYKKMYTSLHIGETKYTLSDTQALRGNIAKQGETLDIVSKKIANIPLDPDVPRAITLQNAIRRTTSNFIKDSILSLPSLPTPAELAEKLNRHQSDAPASLANHHVVRPPKLSVNTGWSPVTSKTFTETPDPLIQQINIVRSYIKQAKEAKKFEEVASLEANLKELEMFYQQSLADGESNNT